jgi:VWFA-related protein
MKSTWFAGVLLAAGAVLSAQTTPRGEQAAGQANPTFSLQIALVSADVIPRDRSGNFVADLNKGDFAIYEDGVEQDIVSMTLSRGGRILNLLTPPAPPAPEGIVLPAPRRPADDASGRVFAFFIDDLHLSVQSTARIRDLVENMGRALLHDGDLFGIVSSGPSSIAVQMTYDRRRLDQAIDRIVGSELKPSEIINAMSGVEGPTEVRHRAAVAMSTVRQLLANLEKVHDRRKALIYVSDGYDFIPFQASRLGLMDPNSAYLQNRNLQNQNQAAAQASGPGGGPPALDNNGGSGCAQSALAQPCQDPNIGAQRVGEEFADAALARDLEELTRTANRANATIYTIDPRGMPGIPDIDQPVEPSQWDAYIIKTQQTLRVLALDTGGLPVVNQNDFDAALKRIDAETSDYYVLGYYSKNPDSSRRVHRVDVRVARPGVEVLSRKEYVR